MHVAAVLEVAHGLVGLVSGVGGEEDGWPVVGGMAHSDGADGGGECGWVAVADVSGGHHHAEAVSGAQGVGVGQA